MITNFVSGKRCIGRVYDRFPINFNGWEANSALWISQGLKKLDIPISMKSETISMELEDYKCRIPDKTAYIRAISWNGYRIKRLRKINSDVDNDLPILYNSEYWYDINSDGYIISNLSNGTIRVYVYKYNDEFDSETNVCYPKVPDNEEVLEYLDWYILLRMLQKGHIVKGYSLDSGNPFTNPALAVREQAKAARNSANSMDSETREIFSRLNRSFLIDYNNYTMGEYNPNYYES